MFTWPRHVGDYLNATLGLSMLEDGAYGRLLDWVYANEKPLPENMLQIYRIARASTSAEKKAVVSIVNRFFRLAPGYGYSNKRCEVEIDRYKSKQIKTVAAANARWSSSKRKQSAYADALHSDVPDECEGNANHNHNQNHNRSSNTHAAASGVICPPVVQPREFGESSAWDGSAAVHGTTAELMSRALCERGVHCTPSNPDLVALVEQGVTVRMAIAAAEHARLTKRDSRIPLLYVTRILESWARQPMPNVAGVAAPHRGRRWTASKAVALAKAIEVGVGDALPGESDATWHARIQAAIDNGGKPPAPRHNATATTEASAAAQEPRAAPSDVSRTALSDARALLKQKSIGGGIFA